MQSPAKPASEVTDSLQAYRRVSQGKTTASPALSRRERLVLSACALVIFIAPWHGGSMFWWSNSLNSSLALLPLLAALWPMRELHGEGTPSYSTGEVISRLIRFPIFWLGLAFFGYIAIQGLNYDWQLVWTEGKKGFYMEPLPDEAFIHWLPTGMQTPFDPMNAWQALLMWLTPWLVVCAMWGSFRRRKAWRIVLWMLAVLAAALSAVGIAASMTSPDKVLWLWPQKLAAPFGPYYYRNQCAVAVYMGITAAIALFFHYQRTERGHSGIQWFALALAAVGLLGNIMNFSRAGWIGTGVILLAAVILLVIRVLWQRDFSLIRIGFTFLLVAASGIIGTLYLSKVDFSTMSEKWQKLLQDGNDTSLNARRLAASKTYDMFLDNPITGWGAGSFRYGFPVYQQTDIRLMHPIPASGVPHFQRRFYWRYAHSDWVQFLAEYGLVGSGMLLLGMLWWVGSILRQANRIHCEHLILGVGIATMIANASLDIVFYNPSLLLIFSVLLACIRGQLQDSERAS